MPSATLHIRLLLLLLPLLPASLFLVEAVEDVIDFQVTEGAKIGSRVGTLRDVATESGLSKPGAPPKSDQPVRLDFAFTTPSRFFALEPRTGEVTVKTLLDRESLCHAVDTCCPQEAEQRSMPAAQGSSHCFIPNIVVIKRNGAPLRVLTVRVHVADVNDEPPKFPGPTQRIVLAENTKLGTTVTVHAARDPDSPIHATKYYRLDHCDAAVFNLSYSRTPGHRKGFDVRLVLVKALDREQQARYKCRIVASDGRHTESMDVELTVEDVNDNGPRWTTTDFNVQIPENTQHYKKIFQLQATDKDEKFGLVRYRFANDFPGKASNPFLLNMDTGVVTVERDLDYDVKGGRFYYLPVIAFDNGKPLPLSATGTLTITVTDVNDNSPEIHVDPNPLRILENFVPPFLTLVTVSDKDQGDNGKVTCHLPDNANNQFELKASETNSWTYFLYLTKPIDRESLPSKGYIKTRVVCRDMGEPQNTAEQRILLFVTDINDNAPKFVKRVFNVNFEEGNDQGTEIMIARAEDLDYGPNAKLEYALVNPEKASFVAVHRHSGAITAAVTFDREKQDRYEFDLIVRDFGQPRLNDTAKVVLHITDRNDNRPKFPGDYTFRVAENTTKNTVLGRLNATDPDQGKNGSVEFEGIFFPFYNSLFRVRRNGEVVLVGRLDREKAAHYAMTVKAQDQGSPPLSATATMRIEVEDVNDSPPRFKDFLRHVNLSCADAVADQIVTALDATDADGLPENRQFKYKLSTYPSYAATRATSVSSAAAASSSASSSSSSSSTSAKVASLSSHRPRFAINEDTGQVTLSYVPKVCNPRTYQFYVTVYDPTNPRFKDQQRLLVSIQGHQNPYSRPDREGQGRYHNPGRDPLGPHDTSDPFDAGIDNNFLIIIILICVSIIILVLMVAVILFMKRRQDQEEIEVEKDEPMSRYASHPSSCHLPRKSLDMAEGSGAISVDDIYKHEELGLTEKSPSKADSTKSNYKTIPANFKEHFNECSGPMDVDDDDKTNKALLDQQASYESQHTYQSMASQDRSSNHEYTDFNQELFSYIPDSNLTKNKKKSPHFTISFV